MHLLHTPIVLLATLATLTSALPQSQLTPRDTVCGSFYPKPSETSSAPGNGQVKGGGQTCQDLGTSSLMIINFSNAECQFCDMYSASDCNEGSKVRRVKRADFKALNQTHTDDGAIGGFFLPQLHEPQTAFPWVPRTDGAQYFKC